MTAWFVVQRNLFCKFCHAKTPQCPSAVNALISAFAVSGEAWGSAGVGSRICQWEGTDHGEREPKLGGGAPGACGNDAT